MDFSEYNPVNYTAPVVLRNPPWADPDLMSMWVYPLHVGASGACSWALSIQNTPLRPITILPMVEQKKGSYTMESNS